MFKKACAIRTWVSRKVTPLKSGYFIALGLSSMEMVADRHRHPAYQNKTSTCCGHKLQQQQRQQQLQLLVLLLLLLAPRWCRLTGSCRSRWNSKTLCLQTTHLSDCYTALWPATTSALIHQSEAPPMTIDQSRFWGRSYCDSH